MFHWIKFIEIERPHLLTYSQNTFVNLLCNLSATVKVNCFEPRNLGKLLLISAGCCASDNNRLLIPCCGTHVAEVERGGATSSGQHWFSTGSCAGSHPAKVEGRSGHLLWYRLAIYREGQIPILAQASDMGWFSDKYHEWFVWPYHAYTACLGAGTWKHLEPDQWSRPRLPCKVLWPRWSLLGRMEIARFVFLRLVLFCAQRVPLDRLGKSHLRLTVLAGLILHFQMSQNIKKMFPFGAKGGTWKQIVNLRPPWDVVNIHLVGWHVLMVQSYRAKGPRHHRMVQIFSGQPFAKCCQDYWAAISKMLDIGTPFSQDTVVLESPAGNARHLRSY